MATAREINDFVLTDQRRPFFEHAMRFIAFERIEGDILEFGVYGGRTLLMMGKLIASGRWFDTPPALVGFDSFRGLAADTEGHARWTAGDCALNRDPAHPTIPLDGPVTPDGVRALFTGLGLTPPRLEVGLFEQTLPAALPSLSPRAAMIHIDCDLYEATCTVLGQVAPLLQPGTLIAFDDWFHYRGDPRKGEARAFLEFLDDHSEWQAIPYKPYATFCNSFIMHRA
ncbi:MAG: class I SAM-dependent methyltransferase [Rhodobacteraceae bacterium]|nr:class I SAM-dependent methyltransferase [Paracoccaceae bacterium]